MSYRTIVVDGHTYKWKVGQKYIEVRQGKPSKWKVVKERPAPRKRWGLITPHMDTEGLNIAIFFNEANCKMAFDEAKKNSSYKDQVEMVSLPPKTVSITPTWIRDLIREKNKGF